MYFALLFVTYFTTSLNFCSASVISFSFKNFLNYLAFVLQMCYHMTYPEVIGKI